MARILTARELSTTQIISLRDDVKRKLIDFAVKETGKKIEDFVVRDIMAKQDLGFANEKWCNQTALVTVDWTKDFSKELPKTKFASFYGLVSHADSPYIIGTKYKVGLNGQTTRDVIMHGRMRAEDVVKCYHDAVLYKGTETIFVEHYNENSSNIAQYGEALELLGLVAEPYGEVISVVQK